MRHRSTVPEWPAQCLRIVSDLADIVQVVSSCSHHS